MASREREIFEKIPVWNGARAHRRLRSALVAIFVLTGFALTLSISRMGAVDATGVVPSNAVVNLPNYRPIRLALFYGYGTGNPDLSDGYYRFVNTLLEADRDKTVQVVVTFADRPWIETHLTVENYDVILFPGGSGHEQAEGLSPKGMAAVEKFVRNGGGYIGICAGGYLASASHLNLIHALPKQPWDRGDGNVTMVFTKEGRENLQLGPGLGLARRWVDRYTDNVTIFYGQGPIFVPTTTPRDYHVFAWYTSEIHSQHPENTTGAMVNEAAISATNYGKGRVLVSSPHGELTQPILKELLIRYVQWASKSSSMPSHKLT